MNGRKNDSFQRYGAQIMRKQNGSQGKQHFLSSYQKFFSSESHSKLQQWRQESKTKEFGAQRHLVKPPPDQLQKSSIISDNVVSWAGGVHQRQDFKKNKDYLSHWTNEYFKY
mmetsp:Transcript_13194/g.22374  ORF Transcript_13194/g.22374 Transcript_13194/m.22374 type:complete len:112 (+) Transcript_13194:763-1098(+)